MEWLPFFIFSIICFLQIFPSASHELQNNPLLTRLLSHLTNRNLQQFSTLNSIFSEITLILPESSISTNGLDLTISELTCSNINVQDIQVGHTLLSPTTTRLAVNIVGLVISCEFRWAYKWTIFNGAGVGKAMLDSASWASVNLDFVSQDFEMYPPTNVDIEDCKAPVEIGELEFDGDGLGFIASIMNLFERQISDRIEGELDGAVCGQLKGLGDGELDEMLLNVSSHIEGYLEPLPLEIQDPLYLETSIEIPRDENNISLYLNFLELNKYTGNWINDILDRLDEFIGGSDSNGELSINSFLRNNFLNDMGDLFVDPLSFMSSNVIFESHDVLTESSLSIESVAIRGLDTFTELDLMNAIGNHTLSNSLKLEKLALVVDMKAFMNRASSKSEAIISAPDSEPIEEKFTVNVTLNDIDIDVSMLLALNKETLGSMQLGPLLKKETMGQCIMSAADILSFTELSISVGDVVPPTLTGFLDTGIDKIVTRASMALFDMYESVLLKAMPNFFQIFVREKLNAFVEDALQLLTVCEVKQNGLDGFIDFRDLLLNPELASSNGGSGKSPYGNVLNWVWGLVQDQVFSSDDAGLLAMNDIFVKPMTKAQSGVEGLVAFNQSLFDLNKDHVKMDVWRAFADNLHLGMSNLRLSGLDTFREPFHIIKPNNVSGHVLENHISLGIENKSLEAVVQFDIEIGGPTSPLAMKNSMDLQLNLPPIEIMADLLATIDESRFMTMPLKDVLNPNCWLSMIATSDGSTMEISRQASLQPIGLALQYFDAVFDDFILQTSCITCSNKALENFDDEFITFLTDNKFFSTVKSQGMAIVKDMLESDWMNGIFESKIQAAALLCPSDPSFDALESQLDDTNAPYQTSRQIIDGILYASMSMAQIIFVVLAQKHADVEVPTNVEIQLDIPETANLIDLTNLTSIVSWADLVFDEASNYLGSMQQNDNGDEVLGIVSIFQSFILDDGGLLAISFVDEGFEAGDVEFTLYNVTLIGLDSFTLFDALVTAGPQTLKNKIKLDTLGVSVDMGLAVGRGSEFETITASLIFKDIELDVSLLMALDQTILGDLRLGSIMHTGNIFYCILSAIHAIGLSEFVMDIGDIESFTLTGFMTESTDDIIKEFTQSMFAQYKDVVLEAFPAFTATTVREFLHGIFQVLLGKAKGGECLKPDSASDNELVDFRDLFLSPSRSMELLGSGDSPYGDLFRMLFNFIEEVTAKSDAEGLSMMNDALISRMTDDGDMHWKGEVFSRDADISLNGLNAEISLVIKDIRIENLDTIGSPVRILQPVYDRSTVLNNSASIGVGNDPLRVAFTLFVSGEGDQIQVKNELELGLSLSSTNLLLELLTKMKSASLLGFPLRDITNINCWFATIMAPVLDQYGMRVGDKTLALEKMLLAVAQAQLDMKCISCSSPVLLEMSSYFESAQGVEDTTTVANMLLKYGSELLQGDYVQNAIDKFLNEASLKCPHSPVYQQNFNGIKYDDLEARTITESSYGFLYAILSVVLAMVFLSALITLSAKFINKRRHVHWMKQLSRSQVIQLAEEEKQESMRQKDINLRMKSLAFSDGTVPVIIRFGMPFVILGNIALFLSGHLSLGGTVNISGQFAGQFFDIQGFFEFSMVNSTIEMWEAGAHSLAILIVIFSGLWPYTKQLIILVLWFLAPRHVASKQRGKMLHWLDVLGKWSMVDVFVLLMSLASFRISIESPSHLDFLPEDLFAVHMMVVPLWGLYANMLAQIVSQISSHLIIHYHRKTVAVATRAQEIEWGIDDSSLNGNDPDTLRKHHFKLDYEASTKHAVIRKGVSTVLALLLISFIVLVIFGCFMSSFSIESVGLLGLAIESMNEFNDAIIYYSVFDLAKMIMDQANYLNTIPNYVGLGTLASLLVVTVFIVPMAQATSLLIEWFRPMNKTQRQRNLVLIEILSAWQYMEVYVMSVVIAAWQLGGVSEYMINAYCDSLENMFNTLSFYGILKESDAQCFRVNASVETATYLLVAAAVILSIVNHFVMSASSQRDQDITTPCERRLHTDRWLQNKETVSLDEEENEISPSNNNVVIAPVSSRFTDLYPLATRKVDHDDHSNLMLSTLSALEDIGDTENTVGIETPVEVETAKAFWDVPHDNNTVTL